MKNILLVVSILLIFLGCSSSDTTDGKKRLEIEKLFDKGESEQVITLLENDLSYQNAYPYDEYKLYLGSAYLIRAGFNLETISGVISNDSDSNDVNSTTTFQSTLIELSNKIDLFNSLKAHDLFSGGLRIDCNQQQELDLNYNQKEVCLFIGITGMLKTAITLNYIVDVDSFLNKDITEVSPKTTATACALEYAFQSSRNDFNGTCKSGATVHIDGNVTFAPDNRYEQITVDVNGSKYSQLINFEKIRSTVLVDGNCTVEYENCGDVDYESGCYACPVAQGSIELPSTNELLLQSINSDLSTLETVIQDQYKDNNYSDSDINSFKKDITNGEDRNVTEEDLINYFNNRKNSKD